MILVEDGDAFMVSQLPNGNKGVLGKARDNIPIVCSLRKYWEVDFTGFRQF